MRKLFCGLYTSLLILTLCGCAAQKPKGTLQDENHIAKEFTTSTDTPKALTVICDGNTRRRHCNTEDGYYYISEDVIRLKDDSFAYHLMYVDFATQQEIYLCNNSGCKHDAENCTAVLPMKDFEMDSLMFLHKSALYILSRQSDNDGTSFSMHGNETGSVEGVSAELYRMELNGTNRKKVFTFDPDLTLESTLLADENGIYLFTKKLTSQQDGGHAYMISSERQLVNLDTSSWELKNICDMDLGNENTTWEIIGCYDNNLVVEGVVSDTPLSDTHQMTDDAYAEMYRNSKTVFATVNLSNGTFQEIHSISNTSLHSAASQNGILYLSLDTDNNIYCFDLRNGEKDILTSLNQNSIYQVLDGVLCTTSWEMTDDYGMNFINMENGEVNHCSLTTKTLGWRLELLGETKDQVLVIYDYDAAKSTLAGNEDAFEINTYKLALIEKDNLYNSIDNFKPIQMVGKGK